MPASLGAALTGAPPNVTITPQARDALGTELASLNAVPASLVFSTANRAFYIPFRVNVLITARKLFWLNGATVAGNIDVGIYDSAGNRLVSTGATLQAGVSSYQEVDVADTVLTPGLYYLAMSNSDATATLLGFAGSTGQSQAWGIVTQNAAHPLPAAAVFAAPAAATIPLIGLTTRASP